MQPRDPQHDRPRRATPRGCRPGFNLVELVLVTVIVGVVAAMAVPRYADATARYRADAAVQRLEADLQRAQTHAEATSRSVRVWFRLAEGQVRLLDLDDPDGFESTYTTELSEEPYRATLTTADFGGDGFLVFDGYGRPEVIA